MQIVIALYREHGLLKVATNIYTDEALYQIATGAI